MSDLKYKSVQELKTLKAETEDYIAKLKSTLNGQQNRLNWIEKYLFEKTPQELTMSKIEARLGHKVIIIR